MKKIFNKLAVLLTTGSLALPLTACVYNFYVDSATSAVIKSYANQTSSVIKALILAKEKNADTSQTIQDLLNEFPNTSITNQTSDKNLNTWEEFNNAWGFNHNINTSGFNVQDYFLASGSGSLTQQVNSNKSMNNIFSQINLVASLNVATNTILYNLIKSGSVKDTIVNFLKNTKKTDTSQMDSITILLKNLVIGTDWANPDQTAFTKNITNPLTSLLNYLVNGWWTPNQATPIDTTALKTFMDNWKDPDGNYYSQWHQDEDEWDLNPDYYQDWNTNDFNFYRGGVLVNYLFYKIGKDYQIKNNDPEADDEYVDRYLGDIIISHLKFDSGISIDLPGILADLQQYFPHLLQNPAYIIMLIEAIIPIIKQWGIKMDVTQGAKKLTFGNHYPSNPDENSYNLLDIFNNIQTLLDPKNKNELTNIIKNIIGWVTDNNNTVGKSFTYDIKVVAWPLGDLMKEGGTIIDVKTKTDLVDSAVNLLTSDDVKNVFSTIIDVYTKWIKQYNDSNTGIELDLTKLQDFLLNTNNGLITAINRDLIPLLYQIMTKTDEDITDPVYFEFYQKLGGKLPPDENSQAPIEFETNSILDLLKTNIGDTNVPLGQVALILLGNSSDNNVGILAIVADNNNQWIKDNYTKYFDVTNKSSGRVYNQIMKSNINGNEKSDMLTYDFVYKINGKTYYFWVSCKSSYPIDFTGTKNFYFTDIQLRDIR